MKIKIEADFFSSSGIETGIRKKPALLGKLTCFYFLNYKVSFVYLAVALVPASTPIGYRGIYNTLSYI